MVSLGLASLILSTRFMVSSRLLTTSARILLVEAWLEKLVFCVETIRF